MAKKIVAVFILCLVVMATMQIQKSEATEEEEFKECYDACHMQCSEKGDGYTFCEMKCFADCGVKEVREKIENYKS